MLSTIGEHPMCGELASLENISSYGLRVRTERPWKPNTSVLFKSSQGDWLRARVIYCQSLDTRSFAVGLELPASGRAMDAAKDWELTMRYRCPKCGRVTPSWNGRRIRGAGNAGRNFVSTTNRPNRLQSKMANRGHR